MQPVQPNNLQQQRREKMAQLSAISVLIVDEDSLVPGITRNVLESFGFKKIFHAKTAQSAIDALERKQIDLIISEWPMCPKPDVNIVNFIRNQNKLYRRIPIILLTAKGDINTVRTSRDEGMTEFLVKPFRVDTLCDRITRIVEKPRKFVVSKRFVGPDRRRKDVHVKDDRRGKVPEADKKVTRKGNLEIVEYAGNTVVVADEDFSIKEKIGFESKLSDIFTEEAIQAAEEVISDSSEIFMDDVSELLRQLDSYFTAIQNDYTDTDSLEQACWCALSIKAKAGIFGFSLASHISKSLHDYTDAIVTITPEKITVFKEHLDTLKVIFHQKLKVDVNTDMTSKRLLSYMKKLAVRYPADA